MGQPQGPSIMSQSLWGGGKNHRARTQSAAKAFLPLLPLEEGEILEAAKLHSDEASSQCGAKHDNPLCNVLEEPSAFAACSSETQRNWVQPRKYHLSTWDQTRKPSQCLGVTQNNHFNPCQAGQRA